MAQKDSQLVIRARDEASKALETITKATAALEKAQATLVGSGDKTSSTLSKLTGSVKELGASSAALAGLDKIAAQMQRAEKSVASLESKLAAASGDLSTYGAKLATAAEANAALQKDAAAATASVEAQAKAVSKLAAEQKKLQNQARATAASLREGASTGKPPWERGTNVQSRAGGKIVYVDPAQIASRLPADMNLGKIGADGQESVKYKRALDFINNLKPGDNFHAPQLGINQDTMGFDDGRHRFAAMRDSGLARVPVEMDDESIKRARESGLTVQSAGEAEKANANAANAAKVQAALAAKVELLAKERAALEALKVTQSETTKAATEAARAQASYAGALKAAEFSVQNLSAGAEPARAALAEIKAMFEQGAKAAGLEVASVEALSTAQKSLKASTVAATEALAAEQARQKTGVSVGSRPGATLGGIAPQSNSPAAAATSAYREFAAAKAALESMYQAMSQAARVTPEMTAAVNIQRAAVDAASASYDRAKTALAPLKEEIRAAAAARVESAASAIREAEADKQAAAAASALAVGQARAALQAKAEEAAMTPLVRMINAYRTAAQSVHGAVEANKASHDGLGASVRNLAGAYLSVFTAINAFRSVVDASVNSEAAQVRIATALGQGVEAGAEAYQHAANAARQLRLDILPTVDAYGQFIATTKDTAIEGDKARQIFDNMLVTMRAFKLSPEAMERATLALKDMAAKGTIARREINQLDLAMPVGALQAMAEAAGYGAGRIAEFSAAVHKGEVGLDILPKTFEIIADRAKKGLPDALNTAQSSLANLRNAIFDLSVAVGQGQFMEGVVKGANALATALKSEDAVNGLRAISTGFGSVLSAIAALLPYTKQIVEALTALAAIKLVGWAVGFEAVASAIGGALTGVRALATAFLSVEAGAAGFALTAEGVGAGLMAIVGFLTGPVGIAIAVGAIGVGLAAWAMNTTSAEDSLRSYKQTMEGVKASLRNNGGDLSKLGQGLGDTQVSDVEKEVVRQRLALLSAKQSLAEYVAGLGNGIGMVDAFGNAMDGATDEQVQALKKIAQAYADGKISGDQFRTSVSEMQRTLTSPDAQAIAENLLKQSQGVKTLTDNTADAATAAKGMGSKLEGLDGDIKKGTSSINDFAKGIRESASDMSGAAVKAATDYEAALGKIESMIPGLKEKLKDLKDAADISANLKKGMDAIDAASAAGMDDRDADRKRRRLHGATDDAKTSTDGTTVAVASALVEHLMEKYGINRQAAIGAVGVMGYESGNFQRLQQQMTPEEQARGERGGYGYTQSTGPRRNDEDAFFAAHPDLDPSGTEGQTRWFDEEASGKYSGAIAKLKTENTVEGGGRSFLRNFEGMVDTGAAVNPDGGVPATQAHIDRGLQYARILPQSPKKDVAAQMADVNKKEKDAADDAANDAANKARTDKDIQSEKDLAALAVAKTKAAKEYDDYKKAHPEAGSDELAAARVKADAGVREIEVAKEVDSFKERNKTATAEEVEQYRQLVAARVAAADQEKSANAGEVGAKHDVVQAQKELNALVAEHANLVRKMNDEGKHGAGPSDAEKKKLEDLDAKIAETTAKLREMYKALGGADAAAGNAELDKIENNLAKMRNEAHLFGMSVEDTKKVANDLAGDLSSWADNFAKKIAEGEKPMQALRESFLEFASSFLQQIAKMIIQQAIFNALGMSKQGDLTGGGLLGALSGGGGGGGGGAAASATAGAGSALSAITKAISGSATGGGGMSADALSYLGSHANKGIDVAHFNPEFGTKIEAMMKQADSEGIKTHIGSGARSFDTQNQLYENMLAKKAGKPAPFPDQDSPAVAARPGSSYHEYGNAADIYASNPAQQARLDALAKQQGLVPGTSFGDQGHFQIAGPKEQGLFANGIGNAPTAGLNSAAQQANQSLSTLTTKVTDLSQKSVSAVPDVSSLGTSLENVATDATKAAGSATGGAGGGGLGSLLQMLMGFIPKHGGGMIGGGSSAGRRVSPLAFIGAQRYHSGGIVGLGANEVPIIANRNEEMLTKSDPRHRDNGGLAGRATAAAPSVKVVNAFDPASFISHGLSTTEGETAMMNFVRANGGAIKGALG